MCRMLNHLNVSNPFDLLFNLHSIKTMATSGKFVSLFKQALNEIPEVLYAGMAGTLAAAGASVRIYYYMKNEEYNKVYKLGPVHMRPDDPRVVKVHKP